ncbi:MAG TPA: sigma-70 family RNA polymerase sigma factor [Candidatus Limnocylindria bacterium]|nr:sigma-70 family RNA polymerase sigma factor [Candidatus Limnocylindria bacterium]
MQPPADPTPAAWATELPRAVGGSGAARATRMDPDRERELVRAAGRDAWAFAELYDFYLPRIFGFVQRRLRDRSVSEDITATTFERALAALRGGRFRNDAFGGWLYRVAANAVIDHVRAARRLTVAVDTDALDPAPDALAAALDRDDLRRAMAGLPDTHRRVLALRFFDDLDAAEAGAVLGCSRRTFAVKLHRAVSALRAALAADAIERLEASDVA